MADVARLTITVDADVSGAIAQLNSLQAAINSLGDGSTRAGDGIRRLGDDADSAGQRGSAGMTTLRGALTGIGPAAGGAASALGRPRGPRRRCPHAAR